MTVPWCRACAYSSGGCTGACRALTYTVGGTVAPGPQTMPINVPLPNIGVTIVTLDKDDNVTIKVDQLRPDGEGV